MATIEALGITKNYGRVEVLRHIDLTVEHGTITALLGPNGTGKTTLVEILEGHRGRDSGSLLVGGCDPGSASDFRHLRTIIGVVLQETLLEPGLSPHLLLERQASYYADPIPPAEILDRFDLATVASKQVRSLSGGMRRRLDLALAFIGKPELLFLDEPTSGLDPVSRHAIRGLIAEANRAGTTVILTSHDLDEVQELANDVHILRDGQFVASGSPREIVALSKAPGRVEFDRPPSLSELLPEGATVVGDRVRYTTRDHQELVEKLYAWERSSGQRLDELTITPPSLDDAYVQLVGANEVNA